MLTVLQQNTYSGYVTKSAAEMRPSGPAHALHPSSGHQVLGREWQLPLVIPALKRMRQEDGCWVSGSSALQELPFWATE